MIGSGPVLRSAAAVAIACLLGAFVAPPSRAWESPGVDVGRTAPRSSRDLATTPTAAQLRAVASAPVVSPEHPVSDPVETPSTGFSPAVAFDGTNYLVVWVEQENYWEDGNDIRGARVTPSGTLLDPTGFAIASGVPDQLDPTVAFGGGTFLVVWAEPTPEPTGDVIGARVSSDGEVLDPSGIRIATGPGVQSTPSVAFGEGTFVVAWSDWQPAAGTSGVYGTRIDPAGRVIGSRIALSGGTGGGGSPAIAFGGGAFFVVWISYRPDPPGAAVLGTRVSPTGVVLDPSGIAVSNGPGSPSQLAVAFDGTTHLVVWQDDIYPSRIRGARVSPTGSVLDPSGIDISAPTDRRQDMPAVTAMAGRFLVSWYGVVDDFGFDVLGTRIDSAGTVLDPSGFVVSSNAFDQLSTSSTVALGTNGSTFFAAWEDERTGSRSPFGAGISADGVPLGPGTLLSRSANSQSSSAVGFDGTNHLVVWSDSGGLLAGRLSPAGRMLDAEPNVLSSGGWDPEVAFDGENYVVAWSGPPGGIAVARVSPQGGLLGPPVVLPTRDIPIGPHVAANGSGSLVTWQEVSRSGTSFVRAARLDPAGALLDPTGILLASSAGAPAVASDGHDFLVTWSGGGVQGRRVASDGSLPGAVFVLAPDGATAPAVAWNGHRYLVVWATYGSGADAVLAARVTGAGVVQDPAGVFVASGRGSRTEPVVAANGTFLVAWREQDSDRPDGLYGARVGDDGVVRDAVAIALSVHGREQEPSLSPSAGDDWAVTYTRFRPESPYASHRVLLRTVSPK